MPGQERRYPNCPAEGPKPELIGTDSSPYPWQTDVGAQDFYYGNGDRASDLGLAAKCEPGALSASLAHVPDQAAPKTGTQTLDRGSVGRFVALTFDDGPSPDQLPRILEILDKHGVPATFFINGEQVTSADAWQQLDDIMTRPTRHLIASHTDHHIGKAGKDPAFVRDEIEAMDGPMIEPFLRDDQPKYVRFPYGAAGPAEIAQAEALGYASVGWDVDTADWCYGEDTPANPEGVCNWQDRWGAAPGNVGKQRDMVGYTIDQVEAKEGGIVLLHDKYSHTPDQLERLIVELRNRGYEFTNIDDVEAFPKLNKRAQQVTAAAEG